MMAAATITEKKEVVRGDNELLYVFVPRDQMTKLNALVGDNNGSLTEHYLQSAMRRMVSDMVTRKDQLVLSEMQSWVKRKQREKVVKELIHTIISQAGRRDEPPNDAPDKNKLIARVRKYRQESDEEIERYYTLAQERGYIELREDDRLYATSYGVDFAYSRIGLNHLEHEGIEL